MYQEYKETWDELIAPGADFEIQVANVRGVPIKTYANAAQNLRDLWLSTQQFAERDYLVYEHERITYGQAHQKVASLAQWLIDQGVKPGDRVAIAMRNYPEWLLSYWATLSIGASVVGMNAWWVGSEMLYALEDSEPKVMILDPERLSQLGDLRQDIGSIKLLGVRFATEEAGITSWSEAISQPAMLPKIVIDTDDDACIFYTSGTTGRPKGAQLTHRGCVSNVWSMMFSGALQRTLAVKKGLIEADAEPVTPSSLVTTPLFHVTANNCVAQGTTLAGGKLTHMYKWDAGVALQLIEKEKITAVSGVPVMAREIISHPDFATTNTSSLLTVGGGGAQLQPDLVGKIEDEVATARPNTGYGMTETCGIITSISADHFVDKPSSCGPAMPAYESKVVNPDTGEELPMGEAGELWVRGAHVIKGYLNREEATAESIKEGWLRTGDMARKDEDDFIFIVDRIKDMVLRGGENIYCAEVESAIFNHSDVAECTVFGVADDRLGEEVGVALLLKPDSKITADELRDHCANSLAKFKIPRYFWFMEEALPRNASGKFLKKDLRDSLKVGDSY